MNREALLAVPFAIFIFILPFPHTTSVRLICLAAAFAIAVFGWRRYRAPVIPAKAAIGAWVGIALLSVVYSFDPGYSFSEVKNEIGYTLMAFTAFLAFTRGGKELRWLAGALVAATLLLSVWGLVGTVRIGVWDEYGGHGGAGGASAFLCVSLPLIGMACLQSRSPRERWLLAIVLVLGLAAGFATRQRTLWPVLLVQVGLAALVFHHTRRWKFGRRAVVMTIATAVLLGSAGLAGTQKWRAETGQIRAVDSRTAAWPAVVEKVLERPWQGAGFGRQAMRKGYPELFSEDDVLFWHAHNMFLNAAVSMGLPGALALLFLMGWFAYLYGLMIRNDQPALQNVGLAGLLLLAGVVGRNLTNDFFVRDGALLFWAANGALLGAAGRLARDGVSRPAPAS